MTVRAAWLLPGGVGNPGQTREDSRLAPTGTFAPAGELTSRPGLLVGGDPCAYAGAAAMDMQIGVGRAVVQGTTAQGAYPVAVDAPELLTFADGDAQYDRIDSVVIRVYDNLYDASGQTLATVEIVPGVPAAAPVVPGLPSPTCLRLYDVTVPAGTSAGTGGIAWASAVVDRRAYTAGHGSVIPAGDASDVGAYDGQYADHDGTLMRWDAGTGVWVIYRPPSPDDGQIMDWTPLADLGTFASGFGSGSPVARMRKYLQFGTVVWELEGEITTGSLAPGTDHAVFNFDPDHRVTDTRGVSQSFTKNGGFYGARIGFVTSGDLLVGTPSAAGNASAVMLDSVRITNPQG